jgi:hypothetical protein
MDVNILDIFIIFSSYRRFCGSWIQSYESKFSFECGIYLRFEAITLINIQVMIF